MRVARLERQASAFEYKTIASTSGRKVNLSRGETLFFAFVGFDGSIKPVSWKEWSKSRLPDQSVEVRKEGIKKALISKANQSMGFAELMEVNDYRGDFTAVMNWLASKGISATARGVKVARLERQASDKIDVQYAIKETSRGAYIDLYFVTDDSNLADMVSAHFDAKWDYDRNRPEVRLGHYLDRDAGVDLKTVSIKLRGADTESKGQRGYMKMVQEAFDKIDRGGFKLRFVRQIQY